MSSLTSSSRRQASVAIVLLATLAAACGQRAAVPAPLPGPTPLERLRQAILAATTLPGVQHGVWGIAVQSLDRDERLFELNPRTLLVPASTAKLVSAASAIDAVGLDFQFETAISVSGPLRDTGQVRGELAGDVLVTGFGDPSIGGRGGSSLDPFVEALRRSGLAHIGGRIIADDDAVEEPRPALAWAWDDLGYRTGAIFGALNYAENRVAVTVTPAGAVGGTAKVLAQELPDARPLRSRVETGPPDTPQMIWPEQRPEEPFLTIAGSIPLGAPPATIQVSAGNPTRWFAHALKAHLVASGMTVQGGAIDVDELDVPLARDAFRLLYIHKSPPLATLLQPLLKDSINLYGEAFLRLNTPPGEFPTNDAALAGLSARLDAWGIPPSQYQIVDGSGLSRRNTITPEALLTVLTRMHDRTLMSPWMTALPIAGVDGSLENRMHGTPAEGQVRAKTGTMTNIRSLAGYVVTSDGEHLAFVVMVNNFEGTGAEAHHAIDTIAVALASFRR